MENCKVIILDEPLNGIENSTKKFCKLIIIATHLKEDIESLVDELYQFDAGQVQKI